jgi:hypothetical protein
MSDSVHTESRRRRSKVHSCKARASLRRRAMTLSVPRMGECRRAKSGEPRLSFQDIAKMNDDTDDTVIRRALVEHSDHSARQTALRRTAQALEVLAGVLAGYPSRHADAWASEAWQKDLKDLEIACEQLRRHATELRRLADGGGHGSGS